jgi:hypothetical protein
MENARSTMIACRDALTTRENEVAKMRLETPAFVLHAGPRMQYVAACQHFVVLQLEHLVLRRQRNMVELSTARQELSFERKRFHRNQDVIAMESEGNQIRYDQAQKRFTEIHQRLRFENGADQRRTLRDSQRRFTKIHKRLRSENDADQRRTLDSQRRFTDLHMRSVRMASIKEEFPIKNEL